MPEYIKLKLTFTIHNPNIIGGTLKKVDADVYLNDVFVGPAYTTEHFDIRAAGDSKIEIHLIVTKPQDMPEQLLPLKIKALGKAIITVFFSDFEIPFDKTETVI
jgi:LEA14-like dessication related protein